MSQKNYRETRLNGRFCGNVVVSLRRQRRIKFMLISNLKTVFKDKRVNERH